MLGSLFDRCSSFTVRNGKEDVILEGKMGGATISCIAFLEF